MTRLRIPEDWDTHNGNTVRSAWAEAIFKFLNRRETNQQPDWGPPQKMAMESRRKPKRLQVSGFECSQTADLGSSKDEAPGQSRIWEGGRDMSGSSLGKNQKS